MLNQLLRVAAVALLVLSLAPAGRGDVTVGNLASGEGSGFPFGARYQVIDGGNRYQQVYLGSLFGSSPISISAVTFYATSPTDNADGTYILSLSTTTALVNGLDTNMANNVGPDHSTFFDGTLPPLVATTMKFTLPTPFTFNPLGGNLLLDVQISGVTNSANGGYIAQNSDFGTLSSRMVNGNTAGTSGYGLVTTFGAPGGAPEPSSFCLAAIGSLAFAGFRRRRCRANVT